MAFHSTWSFAAVSSENTNQSANYAQTLDGGAVEFAKEQQDIALAATALRSGILTERQLAKALGSWTIHGSVTLDDHLVALDLIDDAARRKLIQQASSCLESFPNSGSNGIGSPSESVLISTLDHIDPSGKIARVMGIRAAAGKSAVESAARRSALVGAKNRPGRIRTRLVGV